MKLKDEHIKQEIKQAFDAYQPLDKEAQTRIQVMAAIERQKQPRRTHPMLWRWVAPAAFSLLAIGIVVGQMISPEVIHPSSEQPSSETSIPIQPVLNSSQAVFGFETLSATTLIPMISVDDPLGRLEAYNDYENEVTEEDIALIDHYLRVSEQIIRGQDNLVFDAQTSDRPSYEYKETVTTYTALGQTKVYTYYFNITLIGEEDENSNHGYQGGHRDDTTYEISGIVLYGEDEYELIGRKIEEVSGDNVEKTITTTIKVDAQNYVSVRHKSEDNEESYQYEVVENRKMISKVKVLIEKEEGMSVKVMSLMPQGNEQIRYLWNVEEPNVIEVRYSNQFSKSFTLTVYFEEIGGVTNYTYDVEESGQKFHREENNHGNHRPNH